MGLSDTEVQAGRDGAAESENSQPVKLGYEAVLRMQAAKSGGRSEVQLPTFCGLRGSIPSSWWQVTDLSALGHTHPL